METPKIQEPHFHPPPAPDSIATKSSLSHRAAVSIEPQNAHSNHGSQHSRRLVVRGPALVRCTAKGVPTTTVTTRSEYLAVTGSRLQTILRSRRRVIKLRRHVPRHVLASETTRLPDRGAATVREGQQQACFIHNNITSGDGGEVSHMG